MAETTLSIMLREFLYVDIDKVRSLLAQIDKGIEEEVRVTEKTQSKLTVGTKSLLSHDRDIGAESSTTRSLADGIFPMLEDAMTTSGYLVDISQALQDNTFWFGPLQENHPPGAFVRITAPAFLFDSRYMTRTFSNISVMANALFSGVFSLASPVPKGKPPIKAKSGDARAQQTGKPEDDIESFPAELVGGVGPELLRALAKTVRGMFSPGLRLMMQPSAATDLVINARLQEGRAYIESDAEVLFGHYGVLQQEWTLVGTIGTHAEGEPAVPGSNFVTEDGSISRAKVLESVNATIGRLAESGFVDGSRYPSFTVIPFAVYRPILRKSDVEDLLGF